MLLQCDEIYLHIYIEPPLASRAQPQPQQRCAERPRRQSRRLQRGPPELAAVCTQATKRCPHGAGMQGAIKPTSWLQQHIDTFNIHPAAASACSFQLSVAKLHWHAATATCLHARAPRSNNKNHSATFIVCAAFVSLVRFICLLLPPPAAHFCGLGACCCGVASAACACWASWPAAAWLA